MKAAILEKLGLENLKLRGDIKKKISRDAGMNSLYTEMLMGHDTGLKGRYTKLTPEELLEGNDNNLGYLSSMEHLIICNENRQDKGRRTHRKT